VRGKERCPKFLCRTVHRDPVIRWFPLLLTFRAQKAKHYTWRTDMKKLSGACASLRHCARILTIRGRGVVRSFDPGSVTRGTSILTSMCIEADLSPRLVCWALWPSTVRSSATTTSKAALSSYGALWPRVERGIRGLTCPCQGCVDASLPLQSTSFLSQTL
jgi:hypothetical protein